MYVIVKRVIVIESDEYGDRPVSYNAIVIDSGCHYSMEDATKESDNLNDTHKTDVYSCVFILNHS